MTMRFALALAIGILAWPGMPAGQAGESPLLGEWVVSKAEPAPWVPPDQRAAIARQGTRLVGRTIAYTHARVRGPDPIGCANPVYEPSRMPPEGLFQGSLPEGRQQEAARALSLPAGLVEGVELACSSGLFSYHLRDRDTVLLGLDNVIYTLSRGAGK